MEDGKFQNEVIATLSRLETKMNSVCKTQVDHEKRIRFLEKGIWIAIGILIVADILLSTLLK